MPIPSPSQCPPWRRAAAIILAGVLILALAACNQQSPPVAPPTTSVEVPAKAPAKTVARTLHLIATGDFDGLMKNRLPPGDYAAWRREWAQAHKHPTPASVAQSKQFAQIMQMLTQPGAEARLMQRLQPRLARAKGGRNPLFPVFASIADASLGRMLDTNPQLGPAQRTMAKQGLAALTAWAGTADFSDPGKAKQAIGLVCGAARQLHVQTLKQWRALDYTASIHAYGVIWNAVESLLRVYGLDLGKSLIDAKVMTVSRTGPRAVVKIDLTLAGKPLTGQWAMREEAGHWYNVALLDAWQQAHHATPAATAGSQSPPDSGTVVSPPATAVASPHPAATAAAPPGT